MLSPKDVSDFDQSRAMVVDIWVPLWRGLFTGALDAGFTEGQALSLVNNYTTAFLSRRT